MMFLIGERKLFRIIREIKEGKKAEYEFTRGYYNIKVIFEPYKDIIGVTFCMVHTLYPDISEEQYYDINLGKNRYIILDSIRMILPYLYRQCEIGLYVQYGIWENPLPKETTLGELYLFFNFNYADEVEKKDYKYNKSVVTFKGDYFGSKRITVIYSKKTKYAINIVNIED